MTSACSLGLPTLEEAGRHAVRTLEQPCGEAKSLPGPCTSRVGCSFSRLVKPLVAAVLPVPDCSPGNLAPQRERDTGLRASVQLRKNNRCTASRRASCVSQGRGELQAF